MLVSWHPWKIISCVAYFPELTIHGPRAWVAKCENYFLQIIQITSSNPLLDTSQPLKGDSLASIHSYLDGRLSYCCSVEGTLAALSVCNLLIKIFRSMLINFTGMSVFGSAANYFHIMCSSDRWWIHKYITFAQSMFSAVDTKYTHWTSFRTAEFGMWHLAKWGSHLRIQHRCGILQLFSFKRLCVCGVID